MTKYFNLITAITILLLVLVSTNKITIGLFFLVLAPLSIAMLIIGITELKKSIKENLN